MLGFDPVGLGVVAGDDSLHTAVQFVPMGLQLFQYCVVLCEVEVGVVVRYAVVTEAGRMIVSGDTRPETGRMIVSGDTRPETGRMIISGDTRPEAGRMIISGDTRPETGRMIISGDTRPETGRMIISGDTRPETGRMIISGDTPVFSFVHRSCSSFFVIR